MYKQICINCLLNHDIPDISFDRRGVCNYCNLHNKLCTDYPRGEIGRNRFLNIIEKIKKDGKSKEYDCVIGVSGGTDSTFLLKVIKEYGLRPLAVNFDNGWHTEIAVNNIHSALQKLKIDLRTYVVDWQEMRNIHLSFLKASLPWPDGSTDIGIVSSLYKVASEENIKYVLNGHDFRTEGKQPLPWTHTDGRMVDFITKKYSKAKLKTFPNLNINKFIYYSFLKDIKEIRPFWFLDYSKIEARIILEKELNWKYYGGHHHENIFTRFIIGYWLPKKFNIDKRIITYSAHIRSGEMTREDALELMSQPPYSDSDMNKDLEYIITKLEISKDEFNKIWESPNKNFSDYPNYYSLYMNYKKSLNFIFSKVLGYKPMTGYTLEKY